MAIVYVESKELAEDVIYNVIGALSGNINAFPDLVEGVHIAIGWQLLSDVQESFILKARGEVGLDGIRWQYLSKKYLAYGRRFGTSEQADLKRAAGLVTTDKNGKATTAPFRYAPGGKKGLLTASQLKKWRKYYGMMLGRLSVRMDLETAKRIAAGWAWNKMKAEGAATKLDVFGTRKVEMLRDTSVLFNSLSPIYALDVQFVDTLGQLSRENPKSGQILENMRDGVRVGTSVPYAGSHHYGDNRRGIPARPFWPSEGLPAAWRDNLRDVMKDATKHAIIYALRRAAA